MKCACSEDMTLRFDYNNMMAEFVGEKEGLTAADLEAVRQKAEAAFDEVQANRGAGMMGWTELPYNQDEIVRDIQETAEGIRKNFKSFVVLGIGGSALGPIAVFQALKHLHHNELPAARRKAPKFYVEDNVDPERMAALLDVVDVQTTMFNVITKSGATSETMAQYLTVIKLLKDKLGKDAASHVIATTDRARGNLIKIAKAEGFKTYVIPDGVGGRFSELCPVGLLPAAVLGVDIECLLRGAAFMDERCKSRDFSQNPALMAAVLSYVTMNRGKNVSVMMPYADSLKFMADWYCQLWGESLGKAVDKAGNLVHVGQTPVKALGVTDQHSQIQLYTEGPFDKVVTFLAVENYRVEFPIAEGCEDIPDVGFLGGHTFNELITAERSATEYALTKAHRLNNTITLPVVNAFTVGQLLYFYELQTAFTGAMFGIDTFNQPGVEEGKKATYALLGKQGYDEKRAELAARPAKKEDFII